MCTRSINNASSMFVIVEIPFIISKIIMKGLILRILRLINLKILSTCIYVFLQTRFKYGMSMD